MAEKTVHVAEVKASKTPSGNTRFVLRDEDGDEYTTFEEAIARDAVAAEGRRARIEFHEQQRNGFTNVYLDKVEPLDPDADAPGRREAEEVAWKTAVEATPRLLGEAPRAQGVDPDKLLEQLRRFQDRVADDSEDGDTD